MYTTDEDLGSYGTNSTTKKISTDHLVTECLWAVISGLREHTRRTVVMPPYLEKERKRLFDM